MANTQPFDHIDSPVGLEVAWLPAVKSPNCSPSLNSSGGPHTPSSTDGRWPNEACSGRNNFSWNETTVPKASDMDVNESFDDTSICA